MRIAIDARWIFSEMSGIGVYTHELVCGLAELDRQNDYLLLFCDEAVCDRSFRDPRLRDAPNFTPVLVRHGPFSITSQIMLPCWLARQRIDLFHSTNYMMPLAAFPRYRAGRRKCVVTIHDVIPLILRGHAPRSRKSRLYPVYTRLMLEVGRRADAILTVSRASAGDIVKHLRIPNASAGRVHAVYNGVSPLFFRTEDEPVVTPSEEPARPRRVLYVGRSDPYKNLPLLVRAVAEVRKQAGFPIELVIVGAPDPRYPEASRLAAELGMGEALQWRGHMDDVELRAVYRECDVLAHPSMYEGFGLQILEAMASGLPVVCTTGGSLREVAGDAAVLVEPNSLSELTNGIRMVLERPEYATELAKRGIARASTFSWSRTASETLAVYRDVTGPRAPVRLL